MANRDQLETIEKATKDSLQALQLERLKTTLQRAYAHVPHYNKKLDAAGAHPGDLKELSDLAKFPFTTKDDLRQNYPYGMFAVPMSDIVRIHASSGTTGKPTVVGYTQNDIDTWSLLMARSIRAAGGRSADKIHVAYGYGLFTGGAGAPFGGRALGRRRHSARRRFHRAPGPAHSRFCPRHHHGDAVLYAGHRRRVRAPGFFARRLQPTAGHFRRRAVDRNHARGNRAAHGPAGARSLWPVGSDGARRRPGMRRDARRADGLGGPLLSRDHRSGHRPRAARRRDRRTGVHVLDQGGDAGHPLSHPRFDPAPARHGAYHAPHRAGQGPQR